MKPTRYLLAALLAALCGLAVAKPSVKTHTFEQGQGTFLLDGKPFVVKAAEMHYARIPRPYWEHRIQMCKALGMNTVCLYVFWNLHEQEEGVYDFTTGEKDVAAFVRLCQKNGMWVIVRPGPYVCAEWEMGGLPWWLLKHDDMQLRSLDPNFMQAMGRFERALAKELAPFRLENGGNILMIQVENEYGSYAKDKPYVSAVRDSLRAAGWEGTMMFQCDWSSNFTDNALDDLLWTMNFGTGANVDREFAKVSAMRPDAPKMCSEFWSGWFDGWGTPHQTRPAEKMVSGIGDMLERGISFSLYMTHGGTSFGQWAGANNTHFSPDCTSYDYDAPINEQGAATPKYYQLRELLQKYSDTRLPSVPKAKPVVKVDAFEVTEFAPLFASANLPEAIRSEKVHNMEHFGQGYGSVIYSCQLPAFDREGWLEIKDARDYVTVFIDGKTIGKVYRGNKDDRTLRIPACPEGGRLTLLVEAMGRINYSKLILDRKGIGEAVRIHTSVREAEVTYDLHHWDVRLLPVSYDFVSCRHYAPLAQAGLNVDMQLDPSPTRMPVAASEYEKAGYYRATFDVRRVGDTWLDLSTWGKGLVWVNGYCLGRFWNVGPQQTLYVPGCWLKKGKNEVIVMDVAGPDRAVLSGLDQPVLDVLRSECMPPKAMMPESISTAEETKSQPEADFVGNDAAPGAK